MIPSIAAAEARARHYRMRDLGGASAVLAVWSDAIAKRIDVTRDVLREQAARALRHVVTLVDGSARSVRANQTAPVLLRPARMHSMPPREPDRFARY